MGYSISGQKFPFQVMGMWYTIIIVHIQSYMTTYKINFNKLIILWVLCLSNTANEIKFKF